MQCYWQGLDDNYRTLIEVDDENNVVFILPKKTNQQWDHTKSA